MEAEDRPHRRSARRPGWLAWALLVALVVAAPAPARAVGNILTQDDVTLSLFVTQNGTSWSQLDASALSGFFGPHECLCPDSLAALVELTSSGQTNVGASTITASFLLGSNCQTAPAACVSIGQLSFSATQTASAPTFSSKLVFQAASGSATVDCASLTAGSSSLWAVLSQDGSPLPFALSLALPVVSATVGAPKAVTAQTANEGLLVTWKPPAIMTLVVGYQVLCLPAPAAAETAGYETCGLTTSTGGASLTPGDVTQVCSAVLPATATSVRLSGLSNGTLYTVAMVAIDASGGVSALSLPAQATPQASEGFYEKYKQAGGAAGGCALASSPGDRGKDLLGCALVVVALVLLRARRRRRTRCRALRVAASLLFLLAATGTAQAQVLRMDGDGGNDWAANPATERGFSPVDWAFELGVSLYRPAADSEFGGGVHPYADTFGNSRHLMSEVELVRYLGHRHGAWGLGLRAGYYKVTAAAFLTDGTGRSGDETALRLYPFALSLIYRASDLPGLRRAWLIPYAKAGLDGAWWTATNTGDSGKHSGLSPGWHAAAGLMFGLGVFSKGEPNSDALAGPIALFFEWDYAAINGWGVGHALHLGDSTWFAGIMFDL